jgi:hypothetical protein
MDRSLAAAPELPVNDAKGARCTTTNVSWALRGCRQQPERPLSELDRAAKYSTQDELLETLLAALRWTSMG